MSVVFQWCEPTSPVYRQLYTWMQGAELQGTVVEPNFAAGVRQGFGCFNLVRSGLQAGTTVHGAVTGNLILRIATISQLIV